MNREKWSENEVSKLISEVKKIKGRGIQVTWDLCYEIISEKLDRSKGAIRGKINRIREKRDDLDHIETGNLKNVRLRKATGSCQDCSICDNEIRDEWGISLRKSSQFTSMNTWVHVRCFEKLVKSYEALFENNKEFKNKIQIRNFLDKLSD